MRKVMQTQETSNDLSSLITAIKAKKELQHLNEEFVREQAHRYFQQHPSLQKFLDRPKSEKYKHIVKGIRDSLRRSVGLFHGSTLETHHSTRERLPYYKTLYRKIFAITGTPKTILDLGCGLNPFSTPLMGLNNITYHAYDINEDNIKEVNSFFKKNKIEENAYVKDITKTIFPHADVCFLFKMTDIIDKGKGHKATEALLKKIPAAYVVVSFPTTTMSGRPMNFPRRRWIELLCRRLGYTFKMIYIPTEMFYVIRKFPQIPDVPS